MTLTSASSRQLLRLIGATSIAVIASFASAQEATQFDFSAVPSTRSRAEVRAEVAQARAAGELSDGGDATIIAFDTAPSTLTRAQVIAEAIEARRLGLLGHGELNPRAPTLQEQRMIAEAGRRAAELARLASK